MKKLKRIKYLIKQYDGIWSVPIAFFMFWLVGFILSSIFGFAVGTYDMSFVQPLFLSIGIVIGATNASIIGIYFTFRTIFKFIYGHEKEDGEIKNYSKENWKILNPIYKYSISIFVMFYFITAILLIYSKLI